MGYKDILLTNLGKRIFCLNFHKGKLFNNSHKKSEKEMQNVIHSIKQQLQLRVYISRDRFKYKQVQINV